MFSIRRLRPARERRREDPHTRDQLDRGCDYGAAGASRVRSVFLKRKSRSWGGPTSRILSRSRDLRSTIPYDPRGLHAGLSGRERLAAELRAQKFDMALLLQNAFDAAWLAWRARIPERIGYARDARSFLLTKAVPLPRHGEIPAHESFIIWNSCAAQAGWIPCRTKHLLACAFQKRSAGVPMSFFANPACVRAR